MFSYMGSKWRLAKKYGCPQSELVIEPFAGGACYSLYWDAPKVLLYDINPIIAGMWQYLIAAKESEIASLPLDFEMVDELDVCQEAKWLIGFWITKGNTHPNKSRSAWARQYRYATDCKVWNDPVRRRIAAQLHKIRNWKIVCADYRECPDIVADWFIDPPYQNVTREYAYSDIDYPALSEFCLSRAGRVVVCENVGATWLPFTSFADTYNCQGNKRTKVSKEAIYELSFDPNPSSGAAAPSKASGSEDFSAI